MLVAHMSDLHLGYSQFNLEEREEDVYETFLEAVDISIKERVKLAVIAGDIFHTPRPNGRATFKLAEGLKRLKEKQIPAAFILGEHDISRLRDVPFAYVFGSLGLARRLRLDEPLVVDGLAVFGANKERRNNIDSLVNNLQQAGKLAERHAGKRMLVLHQGLSDFNKFAGEMNSTDIPASFHYYALGHYHDHIEKRFEHLGGPLVYPGSLDLTPSEGIKEVEKGFALVDMSGEEASVNWVPLHRRPQFKATIDYDTIAEGIQGIVGKAKSLAKKPVVRVEIAGRNIDSKVIAANLVRLNDACLHYVWQPLEQEQPMQVYDERPADLDAELLRLSKEALGSDELASLAINDLLGPAAAGDAGEALEIAWEAFKRRAGP
ncbi:DNA repair exonuclease [Nitrososphaera sp.]|uniref:DNA repair exonuclease n=1 Tax=Nitrososphaera sp. TaxID=1971748 RepID=UPI00316C6DD9